MPFALRHLFAVTGSIAFVAACSVGEATYIDIEVPLKVASATRVCDSPFVKPNLTTLRACGGGKGHCYDGTKSEFTEQLSNAECGGGTDVCTPDTLLAAGGSKLKSCTFFLGNKPGACLSLLVKDAAAHKDELKQDVCDPDERCVPCVNPLDNKETHLCDPLGMHDKACVGGAAEALPPSCCHGSGTCMNPEAAPEGQRDSLSHDSCPGGKLCAPAAMVDGNPVHCDVAGINGVCLDICFAAMLGPVQRTMRGGCGPTELCMPCAIGKGQGMPGCN